MSLKESARRYYGAKAGGGSPKTRIATQYLQQLPSTIEKIAINVESKREEAANQWAKKRQSTLDQVKGTPETRAKFAEELDAMKNRYDAAIRKSTGPFAGKNKKQEAANELAAIESEIKAFQEDLTNFDAIMSTQGTYSKGNTIGNSADNAWVYSDESTKNFEFREDGVYVVQPSTGNEIRLRDFKQPLMMWDEGIESAGKMLTKVGSSATSNTPWSNVEKMLVGQANTLMNDKSKFKSLIFDDILDFNFAAENYPDEDLNVLKERYDTDPEFQKEMMSKWKEAYIAEGKEMYDITASSKLRKAGSGSGRTTTTPASKESDKVQVQLEGKGIQYIDRSRIEDNKNAVTAQKSVLGLDGIRYMPEVDRNGKLIGYTSDIEGIRNFLPINTLKYNNILFGESKATTSKLP